MEILAFIVLGAYVLTWNKYYIAERDAGNPTSFKNYIQYLKKQYLGEK